jgi:flavin reductase (DIM6/NTAB) family NADH-FMN oxidoreductase RutF
MAKVDIELARATRLLEPGCIALATARHKDRQNVMTAAWVMPVSNDPPAVALAVHPSHFTYELIERSGAFALNIPGRPLLEKVRQIGELSGHDVDKFVKTGLTLFEGGQTAAPLIVECLGHLECGVLERVSAGNHMVFIGQVLAASADNEAFDGERWTLADESVKPLHHLGGPAYALLAEC